MTEIRCISLTQPWAWVILNLNKRIENRSTNIGNYRGPLLLHAAKRMTRDDWLGTYHFVRDKFGPRSSDRIPPFEDRKALPLGAIVGCCNVVDCIRPTDSFLGTEMMLREHSLSPKIQYEWYMGRFGYVLTGVEATPIIPCSGALGFWRPPAAVYAALQNQKPPTACAAEGSTTTGDQPNG